MIFDTTFLTWRTATRTQKIKAKPLSCLLNDDVVITKLLLKTPEGLEPLHPGNVICIGEQIDTWQQNPRDLLAGYHVIRIDPDGWLCCEPKPGNRVEFYQILPSELPENEKNYIIGKYGEELPSGIHNAQGIEPGDYICRDNSDPTNVWVVRRPVFEKTYRKLEH